jgi:2-keto-4-pentenoate hydratase
VGDLVPIASVDLPAVEARLSTGGKALATGHGAKVMGNPLSAVAWLSEHLASRGHRLEEGEVILTGSLTGHHLVPPGVTSEFLADFGPLGAVTVQFEP